MSLEMGDFPNSKHDPNNRFKSAHDYTPSTDSVSCFAVAPMQISANTGSFTNIRTKDFSNLHAEFVFNAS